MEELFKLEDVFSIVNADKAKRAVAMRGLDMVKDRLSRYEEDED